MNARTNDDPSIICSVTEMAAKLGLSRSRFHQLRKMGVFPPPSRCDRTGRRFYPADLQEKCLEIRRTRMGLDGQPVLFYRQRRENNSCRPSDRKYEEVTDALRALELPVTVRQVKKAVAELYPEGTKTYPKIEVMIGELARHLRGGNEDGV